MAFKKIVVATDGSNNALRAVATAADVGATYQAKVYILHCVLEGPIPKGLLEWARIEHLVEETKWPQLPEWPGYGNLGVIGPNREPRVTYDARLQLGRVILDTASSRIRDKGVHDIEEVFDEGDPAKAVVALADREDIDLAVLGTQGHSVFDHMFMGSSSYKLVAMAKLPVMTVP
jgi:nucleotide-binding universal stress UspA family protein